VDNDHGFLVKNISHGYIMKDTCFLKTVVYCMNGMQTVNISAFVRKAIVSIDVYSLLANWLQHLQNRHEDHMTLFASVFPAGPPASNSYPITNKKRQKETVDVQIGLTFLERLAVELFYKLTRLQDILKADGASKNWFEVLAKMDPHIAAIYESLLKQTSKEWHQRFNDIASDQYEVVKLSQGKEYRQSDSQYRISQLKSANQDFVPVARAMKKLSDEIEFIKTLPGAQSDFIDSLAVDPTWEGNSDWAIEVRQAILNGKESHGKGEFHCVFLEIQNRLSNEREVREKQRLILERLKGTGAIFRSVSKFTHLFRRMNLSYCIELKDDDLTYVLSMQTGWLDIRNCSDLTIRSLGHIMEKCEKLEVLYFSFDLLLKVNALDLITIFFRRRVLMSFRKIYINRYKKFEELMMKFNFQVQVFKDVYEKLRECLPNLEEIYIRDDDLKIDIRIDVASLYQQANHLFSFVTEFMSRYRSPDEHAMYPEPMDMLKLRLLFLTPDEIASHAHFFLRSALTKPEAVDLCFLKQFIGSNMKLLGSTYAWAASENCVNIIQLIETHFEFPDDLRSECLRWLIRNQDETFEAIAGYEKVLKKAVNHEDELKDNIAFAISSISVEKARPYLNYLFKKRPELRDELITSVGMTPLTLAVQLQNFEMVKLLFETGRPDTEKKCKDGAFPMAYALLFRLQEIQTFLFECGARVDIDYSGESMLHLAAFFGEVSFLKMVYEKENDLSLFTTLDSDGDDVLTVAVRKSQKEVVEYLLDIGLESEQAQEIALIANKARIMKNLFTGSSNPTKVKEKHQLLLAQVEIVELFCRNDVQRRILTDFRKAVLYYAIITNNDSLLKFVEDKERLASSMDLNISREEIVNYLLRDLLKAKSIDLKTYWNSPANYEKDLGSLKLMVGLMMSVKLYEESLEIVNVIVHNNFSEVASITDIDHEYLIGLHWKGEILTSLKRYDEAIECYQASLAIKLRIMAACHGSGQSLADSFVSPFSNILQDIRANYLNDVEEKPETDGGNSTTPMSSPTAADSNHVIEDVTDVTEDDTAEQVKENSIGQKTSEYVPLDDEEKSLAIECSKESLEDDLEAKSKPTHIVISVANTYCSIGSLYIFKNEIEKAKTCALEAISLLPEFIRVMIPNANELLCKCDFLLQYNTMKEEIESGKLTAIQKMEKRIFLGSWMHDLLQSGQLADAFKCSQLLVRLDPNSISDRHNLACQFHALAAIESDAEKKNELILNAKTTFEEAMELSTSGKDPACTCFLAEYAMFLVVNYAYLRTIDQKVGDTFHDLVKQGIGMENKKGSGLYYSMVDRFCLPEPLREWLPAAENQMLHFDKSDLLCHYLLCKFVVCHGEIDPAMQNCAEFAIAIDRELLGEFMIAGLRDKFLKRGLTRYHDLYLYCNHALVVRCLKTIRLIVATLRQVASCENNKSFMRMLELKDIGIQILSNIPEFTLLRQDDVELMFPIVKK
jgi:tetratricopeptide (TPR) repeat protein